MAISPFMAAINQLCDEKGLDKDTILETINAALAAAYRKDFGRQTQIIRAEMDPESGLAKFWQVFDVIAEDAEIEDPENQKTLADAKKIKKTTKLEEQVEIPLETKSEFGRIAAQTAKQVVTQRLKEAERDMLFAEFKEKEGQLFNGTIQQIESGNVIVDLGKANGIMPPSDQISSEKYYSGQRLKVYLKAIEEASRGPKILVSRADPGLILGLFENEVPEIATADVEIKGIAREAGSRSKVSVTTEKEGLDPVGSCVGQRGTRIQAILAELPDEKIDIILWNKEETQYIMNALSPAKVDKVKLSKKESRATVLVPDDQLSLAIGTGGQNVRLASKLTGWNLDIEKTPPTKEEKAAKKDEDNTDTKTVVDAETSMDNDKPTETVEKAEKVKKPKKSKSKKKE